MSKTNNQKKMKTDQHMANVLYQKLGTDWYAFAEVEGEMYMSKVEENEMEAKIEESEDFFLDAVSGSQTPGKKTPRVA